MEVYNDILETGSVSNSMKKGIINLIFKGEKEALKLETNYFAYG